MNGEGNAVVLMRVLQILELDFRLVRRIPHLESHLEGECEPAFLLNCIEESAVLAFCSDVIIAVRLRPRPRFVSDSVGLADSFDSFKRSIGVERIDDFPFPCETDFKRMPPDFRFRIGIFKVFFRHCFGTAGIAHSKRHYARKDNGIIGIDGEIFSPKKFIMGESRCFFRIVAHDYRRLSGKLIFHLVKPIGVNSELTRKIGILKGGNYRVGAARLLYAVENLRVGVILIPAFVRLPARELDRTREIFALFQFYNGLFTAKEDIIGARPFDVAVRLAFPAFFGAFVSGVL